MADKPLVIDTAGKGKLISDLNSWHYIDQQERFISSIETSTINEESADVGTIVSGIPTVFARVNLFRSAIAACANPSKTADTGNLQTYYSQLASEWKGLIAAIACDYPNFGVRRINMQYSDGKGLGATSNVYEPKGAFGNMLMEGKNLWCNQEKGDTLSGVPFIDIIKYDGQVVAGTSPYSMVFTGINYKISRGFAQDKPWVNPDTGRFQDPLESQIGVNHLRTLFAYVNYLLKKIPDVEKYYNDSEINKGNKVIDYASLTQFIHDWREQMKEYAKAPSRRYEMDDLAIPTVNIFDLKDANNATVQNLPYSIFFNYQNKLWGVDGNIYDNSKDNAIAFDPQELLLPEESEIARIILPQDADETKMPVLLLKARIVGSDEAAFFALPISPKGLEVFGKNLGALVGAAGQGVAISSTITAQYDPSAVEKQLRVTLRLVNSENGSYQNCERAYTIKQTNRILNKDIIIWPNFVSRHWKRYFLYSEMPHNTQDRNYPYRATPFVADVNNELRIVSNEDGSPYLLAQEGQVNTDNKNVEVKLPIVADSRIADKTYKYEIYESNCPFKGVELTSASKLSGGFLIIRYDSSSNSGFPQDMTQSGMPNLRHVNLGVDFGSTNTSIAYYDPKGDNQQAQGFVFENLRVSLLGGNRPSDIAIPSNLFFFPSATVPSNAVKSILALHDRTRMVTESSTETEAAIYAKEVKGGFPCFVRNLPIDGVERYSIRVNLPGCGNVRLVNDMKWTEDPEDESHKIAFLRTLMLQIYAQFFVGVGDGRMRMIPTELKWSYPSSMSQNLCQRYQIIWRSLRDICPIIDNEGKNIDLTVASYNVNLGDPIITCPETQPASKTAEATGWGDPSASLGNWGEQSSNGSGFGTPVQQQVPDTPKFGKDLVGKGWSNTGSAQTVQGAARFPIENPDATIVYNPHLLNNSNSSIPEALPEACAVANYLAAGNNNVIGGNTLTLCFDIGGSTTDITALCKLRTSGNGLTMIKQNSIRFAAQNVAQATRKSPNFRNTLLEICVKYGIHIEGLSAGPDSRFTSDTAPYYFEQIVDRLNPEQLKFFYEQISMKCQELMCVNLYVTGLIMFYAGQLTAKLVNQLKHSQETMLAQNELPHVNIAFAGKGARLFEWWSTTDLPAAQKYYCNMFIMGMGGMNKAQHLLDGWPTINLSGSVNEDVKFEVSKGLACTNTSLFIPTQNAAVEIIGENGFARVNDDYSKTPLPADHILTPEMMAELGQYFVVTPSNDGNPACTQFMNFTGLFFQVASGIFNFKMTKEQFFEAFKKMNIDSYIINLPEYRTARRAYEKSQAEGFGYVAPIIILEGAKFFKDYMA